MASKPAGRTPATGPNRPLRPGVIPPILCFFDPVTEDLDTETIAFHVRRMADAGVAGIAVQGSNGEAVNLNEEERRVVTRTAREALDRSNHLDMPLIVGCGAQSVRGTVELCRDAHEAGGDYALVLPPSYYKGQLGRKELMDYYLGVADGSPIPILIYNYPAAASGTDLDHEFLIEVAGHAERTNIVGVKFTCGNVGKLNRVASARDALSPANPRGAAVRGRGFLALAGSADFMLQALEAGGSGALCGLANVAPRTCVALFDAWAANDMDRARHLQKVLARGDWAAIKGNVPGTKFALRHFFGYGGHPRAPLPRLGKRDEAEAVRDWDEIARFELTEFDD